MKKTVALFCSSLLLFVLVFGCFPVSAFAAVNPDFEVPVITNYSSSTPFSALYPVYSYPSGSSTYTVSVCVKNSSAGFSVCAGYPGYFIIVSTSQPSGYYLQIRESNGGASDTNVYSSFTVDGTTYYQTQRSVASGASFLCHSYSDYQSALSACIDALNYTPASTIDSFSIVLYPGYALEITSDLGFDGLIEALQPVKNVLPTFYSEFGGYWWPGCPSGYTMSSSPFNLSVGSVLSSTSFNRIPWSRVNTDFLGQTKQSKWQSLFASSHVLIYNPYIYIESSPLRGNYDSLNNTPVTITLNSISDNWDYKLYKLSDNVVTGLTSAHIDSTIVEVFDKNPDMMGGFVNSDGSPVVQKIGGGLASDNDQQLTLDSLVSDLDNFFRGSWEHIRFLINTISDFPAYIATLYSWLPAEYRAVIFAGFSLSMVVGVLKVML